MLRDCGIFWVSSHIAYGSSVQQTVNINANSFFTLMTGPLRVNNMNVSML